MSQFKAVELLYFIFMKDAENVEESVPVKSTKKKENSQQVFSVVMFIRN